MSEVSEVKSEQPTVITLTKETSINIFIQYIEIAQKHGAYELKEAEILKRAIDVLLNNVSDNEINENLAINLLIQGVNKGQKHGGAYTLNDAALLQKVIQYIVSMSTPAPAEQTGATQLKDDSIENDSEQNELEDDLASLSEPVPLRPKEI